MNHIYRIVFNKALGVYQVVSELVRSPNKTSSRLASSNRIAKLLASKTLIALLVAQVMGADTATAAQVTVPVGGNVYTYLNGGNYDLLLSGAAVWNTAFTINTAARSTIIIDGAGNTVTVGLSNRLFDTISQNNNSLTLNNTIFTTPVSTNNTHPYLFNYIYNINALLTLDGTTFTGFGGTGTGYDGVGANIIYVNGSGANVTVDGGVNGVTFTNNRGTGDSAGVIGLNNGTINFTGPITFDSNWTGNYGGAMSVYSVTNAANFNGTTLFKNNHATVFGGALDVWGGPSTVTFNGPTTFDGNYIYYQTATSTDSPGHINDQHPRGGAINIGYVSPGATGTSVIFNSPTSFLNNYVVSTGTTTANRNALGGAISAYGNGAAYLYRYIFNAPVLFEGNYVYTTNAAGVGNGGAIYYDASAALIDLASGTQFLGNYAKSLGGAIYLQSGTINLNATTDDIRFQGNYQGASFDTSTNAYKPIADSGIPNAIYLGSSGNLNFNATSGNKILFYDPIASIVGSTVTVTKTGDGEVVFYGDNGATSNYDSNIRANTVVSGGYFTLDDAVKYGVAGAGTFTVNSSGTVRGGNGAQLNAQTVTVQSGGNVAGTGGDFTVNANTVTIQNGGGLAGLGTLLAPSNISILGTINANIVGTDQLNIATNLLGTGGISKTGSGTLNLQNANTYTGTTAIGSGTLLTSIANAFGNSSSVSIASGGALVLNNFNQTVNLLSGAGNISLGSATLTENNATATSFSGAISGSGNLVKSGAGALTLSGTSGYSGGTSINAGSIIATNGNALGTGAVTNNTGLTLAFASDSTLANQLSGAGSLTKSGTGNATLTASGSSQGVVNVNAGTLTLAQNGVFNSGAYTTGSGANTTIDSTAQLNVNGAFTQAAGSSLFVDISNNPPLITATSATLNGVLSIIGFSALPPASASAAFSTLYSVLETTGGIVGDFSSVNINGFTSTLDYLTLAAGKSSDNLLYQVGYGLTWQAGSTLGDGTFTLAAISDSFNLDVALADEAASATGWNGRDLTKAGAGTLTLSAQNSYTGTTTISGGTLNLGVTDALAGSSAVTVGSGTTLALNGFNQTLQQLGGAGAVTLGAATLTASNTGSSTFSGVMSGTGSLVKTGAGTLTLSGDNDYTSTTSVSGGTLSLGIANALSDSSAVTVGSGTTLALNGFNQTLQQLGGAGAVTLGAATLTASNTGSSTFSGVISGTGSLVKTGAGTLTLSGDNGYTGTTSVSGGTLSLGIANALSDSSAVTVGSGTTLALNGFNQILQQLGGAGAVTLGSATLTASNGGNSTFSGVISGTGSLEKTGAGTLTLSGDNGYTGTTTVSGGTLSLGIIDALNDSSAVTVGSGTTLALNGFNQTLQQLGGAGAVTLGSATLTASNGGNSTFSGVISGTGSLMKTGAGTLTLSGDNAYTGTTSISGGTLSLGITNALSDSSAVTVGGGTTLALNGFNQTLQQLGGSGSVTLGSATLTASNTGSSTFSGVISGTGSLVKTGTGTLTLSGDNGYSGTTSVSGGTLSLGIANAISDSSAVTVGSGTTLALNGFNQTLQQLGGAGAVTLGAATLTASNGGNSTFSGVISGTGSLVKTGAGTLTLSGDNAYTGTTSVSGGTLSLGIANALSDSSAVTVGSGTTLALNGFNQTLQQLGGAGAVTLGSATLTASNGGNSTFSGVISGTGSLMKTGAGILTLSGDNAYTGTTTVNGGTLSLGIIDALADSSAVTVGSGTTLALNGFNQTLQQLGGAGAVTLGSATLTANNSGSSTYSGVMSGSGALVKTGSGSLTLSGNNNYSGGTTVSGGNLTVTQGAALGSGAVTNNAALTLAFTGDSTLANALSGNGSLTKNGSGNATLTAAGSSQGSVNVDAGTLTLAQNGAFEAGDYTTASGATTVLAPEAQLTLSGALTQAASAALQVGIGSNDPAISALSATLGGTLQLSGYASTTPVSASALTSTLYTVLQTTAGISGDFSSVSLGGATSSLDYLTLAAGKSSDNLLYQVGYGLTWQAGSTLGDGTFTLAAVSDSFNLDVALGDEAASATGWNGRDLTKAGLGTLTLSAQNSYTGTTTVSGGTLSLGIADALADSSAVTVGSGTTLALNGFDQTLQQLGGAGSVTLGSATLTASNTGSSIFSGGISGTGSLVKTGAGTLTLSGDNGYTGTTSVSGGTLSLGIANAISDSSAVTVGSGTTLALNGFNQTLQQLGGAGAVTLGAATLTASNGGNSTFSGVISGTGSLVKTGAGTLTLSGDNAYTGTTSVSGGTLSLGITNALSDSSAVTVGGGTTLALNGFNQTLQQLGGSGSVTLGSATLTASNTGSSTFSGVISGTGSLVKTGTGTLTLSGDNGYSGTTSVSGGTLSLGIANAISDSSAVTVASGTTLALNGFNQTLQQLGGAGAVTLGSAILTASNGGNSTFSGVISGTGSLVKTGAGTLTLSGDNGYTGTTSVSGGTLSLGIANALSDSSAVTVGSGTTLALNGFNQTLQQLGGAGAVTLGAATLTASNTGNSTFSGVMSGSGALVKTGAGTLTLSGDNAYTGTTTVSGGTLSLGIIDALADSSAVTVSGGTTLALNGFNQTLQQLGGAGAVTLGSATLTANNSGSSTFSGVMSGSGALEKTGTGSLTLSGNNNYSGGTTVSGGNLTVTQGGALGSGAVTNNAALTLAFTGDSTVGNVLSGSGNLTKNGSGNATLTANGSSQGSVTVDAGTLTLAQNGAFGAGDYTTASGATTVLAPEAQLTLSGALTQAAGAVLQVGIGSNDPAISALSATLDGVLELNGYSATAPASASALSSTLYTVLQTTAGISGDFSSVSLGGATSALDYLTLAAGKSSDNLLYQVGYGLTWQAGSTLGDGTFTLAAVSDSFNLDVALGDEAASATGWNGRDLTKAGLGTLTLSAQNSYTGTTTVNSGTLSLGIADALVDSSAVTVGSGTTLALNGFNQTLQQLSGAGAVTLGSATLTASNGGSSTFSGVMSGTGGLVKIGAGTLTLSGDNSYTGATTVSNGTLDLGIANALSDSSAVTVGSGATLALNGFNQTFQQLGGAGAVTLGAATLTASNSGNSTFSGVISGSGALVKTGAGTLTLSGDNAYTGTTSISGGTLNLGIANALSDSSAVTVGGGTTLALNGFNQTLQQLSGAGAVTLGSATLTASNSGSSTFSGVISGTGSLVKTGTGTLTLSGDNGYTGTTSVSGGTLSLGIANAISDSSAVTVASGTTLALNGFDQILQQLSGAGAVTLGSATLTASNSGSSTFSGVISGTGDLVKTGVGSLTLSGNNNYSGGTTVSGGTLTVTQGGALGSGAVINDAALTLAFAGNSTVGNALSGSGSLIKNGSGNATLTANGSSQGSVNVDAGGLTLAQGVVFNAGDYTTANGATSTINPDAQLVLSGTLTQASNAILQVGINLISPAIRASSAVLAGELQLSGYSVIRPANASELTSTLYTVIQTISGFSGDFSAVDFGGSTSDVDYLTLAAGKSSDNLLYQVGYGLTWQAGSTLGDGTFTLADITESFNLDVALGDEAASATGWNGRDLTKAGLGTLTLSAQNSYTGTTTVNSGTLSLGIADALVDSSAVTVGSGTTLALNGFNQTLQQLSGAGAVTLGSATLTASNGGSSTFSGVMSGTGGLVKIGAGTLTLSGDNSYTGATTVSNGTLDLGIANALSDSSAVTVGSGATLALNGFNQTFQQLGGAGAVTLGAATLTASNSGNSTFSGVISGSGTLVKTGAGTLTLSGDNAYTGTTSISGGTLNLGIANALSDSSAVTVGSGTTLALNGFNQTLNQLSGAGAVTLGSATLTASNTGSITLSGVISGTGSLVKTGAGTLTLSGDNGYTGTTTVSGGTLSLGIANAISDSSAVTVASGTTLALNGFDQTLQQLSGVGAVTLGTATLTASNSGSSTFSGVMSGTGDLVKTGAGSLTLSGNNNYSGGTTVSGGTLTVTQGAALGSGAVTNDAALTLAFAGDSTVGNVLSGSGSLTKNGSGNATLTADGSRQGSVNVDAGTLTLAQSGAFSAGDYTTASGATTVLAPEAQLTLSGALTQAASAVLQVGIGSNEPTISALSATLGGALQLSGYASTTPVSASALTSTLYTVLQTTEGISGDFSSVSLGGASSALDYLTLAAGKSSDNLLYQVGYGLTWQAGSTLGDGTFTLAAITDSFNLDVALGDEVASATGWNGRDLTKAGLGTLTLSAQNSYTGTTTVNGGTLSLGIADALADSSAVTVGSGTTLALNGFNQTLQQLGGAGAVTLGSATLTASNTGSSTFSGVMSGTGGLVKTGAGSLTLSGDNSYTGATAVNGGTLSLGIIDALSDSSAVTVGSGATLALNGFNQTLQQLSGAGAVTLGSATLIASNGGNSTFSGVISGTGSLVKTGAGTLTLSGDNGYTGTTTVSGGTLSMGIIDALADSSAVTVGSGTTLALNGFNQTLQQLGGAGAVTLGSATLTASNTGSSTFSGGISGSGALVKTGAGSLTLSGTNNYSGGTTVSDGNLTVTQGGALGSGAVTNDAALTLTFAGDSTVGNVLSGSGSLTKNGSGNATLTADGSRQGSVTVDAGTLTLAQSGAFSAGSYTTAGGATTVLASEAQLTLSGALTQATGAVLQVGIGSNDPAISALSATLDGTLQLNGYAGTAPVSASALTATLYTVLQTTAGISGDFSSVSLGGATSSLDYLTLAAGKSSDNLLYQVGYGLTWQAGSTLGDGTFTLAAISDSFNLDVALGDEVASATGWNGRDLTKAGAGTLTLSAQNSYTGTTTVSGGTLSLGIADALADSSAVTVASGTTLALNGFDQTLQQLSGAGVVTLGAATLTASNSGSSTFSGGISGSGALVKTGSGSLTLSGTNNYSGGTTVSDGNLAVTQGAALGSGAVTNDAALTLAFADDSTVGNVLSGSGSLTKNGSGNATLTADGSRQGSVTVDAGTLTLAQNGAFGAGDYTTASGATTVLAPDAQLTLSGALTQAAGAVLQVGIGSNDPAISANSAVLAGELQLTGYSATAPVSASALTSTLYTVLQTTAGISGDFSSVSLGGASSALDYLTLAAGKSSDNLLYQVGYGLTWQAGSTLGDGTFTLAAISDSFNLDVALGDEAASATGWNGRDLTKAGAGTLTLSAQNSYTGSTTVSGGTLRMGIADALADSSAVTVASGTTLALNGFDQTLQQLGGAGAVTLGSATLTASNTGSSIFNGGISGTGDLVKTGAGSLTLSGTNNYSGGTTVSDGNLTVTQGGALGSGAVTNDAALTLAFAGDSTVGNVLSGSGSLTKNGSGNATLTADGNRQGSVNVDAGTLTLAQSGAFSAGSYTTADGATTVLAPDAQLTLSGALTQATGAVLQVGIGSNEPTISALSATLGGALQLNGYSATAPVSASALTSTLYTVLQTTAGISGDFSSVSLGGASSALDYLTLAAGKSSDNLLYQVGYGLTWQAGSTLGDGTFTLAAVSDSFNLDVALGDEAASATGWNGRDLTKAGAGTLTLSAQNSYTGSTTVSGGTLSMGIIDALADSSAVTVASGTTLALNGFDQTLQQLSGAGVVTLGAATLTASNNGSSTFSGGISGSGALVKTGAGSLTLSGTNNYSGGTTVSDGTLAVTQGAALGSGAVTNDAALILAFAGDSTVGNALSGSGSLTKNGNGNATLTADGSRQGSVTVDAGTLTLAQSGVFSAGSYTTAGGATTVLSPDAQLTLSGALTQAAGAVLQVGIGSNEPTISALSATLGGALQLNGYSATAPVSASALTSTLYTVLQTTAGISGDFSSVSLGGASSALDYLTLAAGKSSDNLLYQVGYGLTWQAGSTLGDGTFTLAAISDSFNLDIALEDEVASATGWNGRDLTKAGAGTLTLSAQNSYTGTTTVSGGTLSLGIADALADSSAVTVGSGTTLALNGFDQTLQQLSGAGVVTLGAATLTASNSGSSIFSGGISGSGALVKTGAGSLTLSGTNNYSGGTTVSDGNLTVTQGAALGSGAVTNDAALTLAFAGDSTVGNVLSGSGSLTKNGSGNATLTANGSRQGSVTVDAGTLTLAQSGAFSAGDYTTASGATTVLAPDAQLTLSGALTQAASAVLQVGIGSNEPSISALSATLDGALQLNGYSATAPVSASALTSTLYTVLQTTAGISGDFSSVSLGGASSALDYLTLAAGKSSDNLLYQVGYGLTWQAGSTLGDGTFTLAAISDSFNLDVTLGDQAASATGWNGRDLTKAGAGTLTLSAQNSYTGSTTVSGGTLSLGIADALADSSAVTMGSGTTLALNGFNQTLQQLSGAGSVTLGSATLTASNSGSSTFSGGISGTGDLVKTGAGSLTLSGTNNYSGGTTVSDGTLAVTQGAALGSGAVTNDAALTLAFAGDSTVGNGLSGSGSLTKNGSGNATLTANGSRQGSVNVDAGTLTLAQGVVFSAGDYTTANGATSTINPDAQLVLSGTLTQASNAILQVGINLISPAISANSAVLAGELQLAGYSAIRPANASELTSTLYTVIQTAAGLSGDFSAVDFGGSTSEVDYLTLAAGKSSNNLLYQVGYGLTWQAGSTFGDGNFTLTEETFNLDMTLSDQGASASGWNGRDLTKNGSGTLILSADNTYTGLTTINGGTLQVGNGGTLGSIVGNVVNNGSLIFDRSDRLNFAGEVTGSGALQQAGSGVLVLTGNSNYGGGTIINNGALHLGDGGTQGMIAGNVLDNTALAFNRSDDVTFAGQISGSGALWQIGNGKVVLTGNNSYSGGTFITAGTLQVGEGGTQGSLIGNINNDGTLIVNRSDDIAYAGSLGGSGSFIKQANNSLALSGDSSGYLGDTRIEAGSLMLDSTASLGGTLEVLNGAKLGGSGTVGTTVVDVGGTVSPGHSIGTLNVAGNMTFEPGSQYLVEVNPTGTESDLIHATGTTTLNGGSVVHIGEDGNFRPLTIYTIITADQGVSGQFDGVSSNYAFLTPTLSYDTNHVMLSLLRNQVDFAALARTPNQRAAAGGAQSLGSGGVYDAIVTLGQDIDVVSAAFDQISGELYASSKAALIEDSRFVREAANNRLRGAFGHAPAAAQAVEPGNSDEDVVTWGQAFGAWGATSGDGNAARLDRDTGGVLLGADKLIKDNWRVGVIGGYSHTNFDVNDRNSSGSSNNYHLGVYAGTQWDKIAFRSGLAYSWHDISTERSPQFAGFSDRVSGDYRANTLQTFGELGYTIQEGNTQFEPFANLTYLNLHTNGLREQGGAAALNVNSSNTDATFTSLGIRSATDFKLGDKPAKLKGTLGWRHNFGAETPTSTQAFSGGDNFTVASVPIAKDAVIIETGLEVSVSQNASVGISYSGQFGSGSSRDQSALATFNWKF